MDNNEDLEIISDINDEDYDFSIQRFHKINDYDAIVRSYASSHGVLSLSASYDTSRNPSLLIGHPEDPRRNLLMWAHYSANHTGFVIEFDPSFIKGAIAEKVCYQSKRPSLTFEDIDLRNFPIFFVKSPEWSYENEWRLIRSLDKADKVMGGVSLFNFDKSCVKSITTGSCMNNENKEKINRIIDHKEYQHVQLFHADLNKENFSLDFNQTIKFNGRNFSNGGDLKGDFIKIQKAPQR